MEELAGDLLLLALHLAVRSSEKWLNKQPPRSSSEDCSKARLTEDEEEEEEGEREKNANHSLMNLFLYWFGLLVLLSEPYYRPISLVNAQGRITNISFHR